MDCYEEQDVPSQNFLCNSYFIKISPGAQEVLKDLHARLPKSNSKLILASTFLGATSIEKIPKISASGQNFLDPSPPYSKKEPTDKNVGILDLMVFVKFVFSKFQPPLPHFGKKLNFTDFVN